MGPVDSESPWGASVRADSVGIPNRPGDRSEHNLFAVRRPARRVCELVAGHRDDLQAVRAITRAIPDLSRSGALRRKRHAGAVGGILRAQLGGCGAVDLYG